MVDILGRFCEINGISEVSDLKDGFDFRLPQYRREVFLRFFEFHDKYRGHAGAVYSSFPYVFEKLGMTKEERIWFAFINGCSQHVVTTYLIFERFPNFSKLNVEELNIWFYENYKKLGWDTDRRYFKNSFIQCVKNYKMHIGNSTQEEFFERVGNSDDPYKSFENIWKKVLGEFAYFGRLSTFSYLEFLKLSGVNLDCNQLFLDDIKGSKSHRNGICKVIGRDDWEDTKTNKVIYTPEMIEYLSFEGGELLKEAKKRFGGEHVNYFTLETTLCCYKGWHRVNRRYPNVYNDMFHDRIKKSEEMMGVDLSIFWESRERFLPKHLRLESSPEDIGFCKDKQNHYRLTGEVIMMDNMFTGFKNNLKKNI